MKRYVPKLLLVFFVAQLLLPGYLVYRHYSTLSQGESFKFEVAPYDPYDPFRGRYVALRTTLPLYDGDGDYLLLSKDAQGYAQIDGWATRPPEDGAYMKNPELERYYMNEQLAPEAERLQRELDWETNSMYLLVKVRKGHFVIQGLYLNGVPVEELLTQSGPVS